MKKKFQCPFGSDWIYVTVVMPCIDGVQTQKRLWRKKKTGELRWEKL